MALPQGPPQQQQVAAPQRAAMRPDTAGLFRSLGSMNGNGSHQRQPLPMAGFSPSMPIGPRLPSTHAGTNAQTKTEWESARMEELSQEIRKLLGPSTADGIAPLAGPDAAEAIYKQQPDKTLGLNSASAETTSFVDLASSEAASRRQSTSKMPAMPASDSVLNGLDLTQPLNLYKVPDGIMQVFIMSIHPSNPINRPYVVVRLGDQVFQTSIGKLQTGNWNEGFELIVSYHMQLFGTVHMDVYSSNMLLPDTLVGRAEIKISLLEGFPEIFTSYYEIWDKKLAASTVPEQRQRQIVSKNLGALQVRVNYRYQKLEDPESKVAKVRGAHISGTVPNQLVNKVAADEDPSSSVDMPLEELVAKFANEYNLYMEMVHTTAMRPYFQNMQPSDDAKSTVGFAKVDDDSAPKSAVGAGGESGAPDAAAFGAGLKSSSGGSTASSGSAGWFADLFTSAPSTQNAVDNAEAAALAAAEAASASRPSKMERMNSVSTPTASEKTLMQSLASMFVSPSTFMAIKSLDRLVGNFNQGVELSNTEILGGLLTLYKFYNEAEIPGVTRPHRGQQVESAQELEIPGHYARFALASYGWRALYFFNRGITLMDGAKGDSDVTSVLQYLNLAQEDLLGYEFRSSQLFCPSYFVAHDKKYKSVVLVVRGTMSAEDTVVDLSCEYTKWNGGLVHSGMQASAHWLFVKVMPLILAYAKSHDIKSIRIVGHSLGASTAAILTIMVQSARDRLAGLGIDISEYDMKTYCYGPAPCISDNLAEQFEDYIETFVHNDDFVPRLCYGSVSDFKRMAISAADESDNLSQRLYAPFEDSAAQKQRWEERFARLVKIRENILATQENLHLALPGAIHHMIAYRGTGSKSKKEARNPELDVAIGRRELFRDEASSELETDKVAGQNLKSTRRPKQQKKNAPPPPPTPATKVRADSVDPEDLAEAINTSIIGDGANKPLVPQAHPAMSNVDKTLPETPPPTPATASASAANARGSKFYPVWVQKMPSKSFREIVLRPTMITDHMPSAYESAFARAIETQIHEKRIRDNSRRMASGSESSSSSRSLASSMGDVNSGGGSSNGPL
ncbi:hypothetical protein LPJ66_007161 [Kickxella alabastrina]|uniref:Uncharacterized protein n=1 Tax=Kickxella alabastrina TaxID=61397 RepID=A0ACC1IB32_9FUNG|nr:hypothetical protein LPJ66_007161 [Kickxella alabastrina]